MAKTAHTEIHVFVIWPWAKQKKRIARYIRKHFYVLDEYWPRSVDVPQFYNLKERPAWPAGGVHVLIVRSIANRMMRETSTGRKFVNPDVFDAKIRLRKWGGTIGKLNSVHGSDDAEEAVDNLRHILDPYDSIAEVYDAIPGRWVVLRNFRDEPGHGDIDILVENQEETVAALGAVRVDAYRNIEETSVGVKNKYLVRVGDQLVTLDLRYVGDNYFDERWETSVLDNRVREGDFWRPCDEDWYWTLLYHSLIHKGTIEKYSEVLDNLKPEETHSRGLLEAYVRSCGYEYTIPDDPLVLLFGLVRGQVVDGLGAASTLPQDGLADVWRKACGYEPYPGTLNIEYEREFVQPRPSLTASMSSFGPNQQVIELPLYFWNARLDGIPVVLSFGGNQENQCELLAKDKLRDVLDLKTGDEVTVVVV